MLLISPGWNRKAFWVFPGSLCSWPDCRFPMGAVEKCVVQARGVHGAGRVSGSPVHGEAVPEELPGGSSSGCWGAWSFEREPSALEAWRASATRSYSVVGVWLSVLWLLSFTALLVEEVGCQCWATVDVDVLWTLVWSNLFGTSGFQNPPGRKKMCVWICGADKVLSKQQRRFKVFTMRQLFLSICTCLVGWEILASNSVIFTFKKILFPVMNCLAAFPLELSVFGVWIGDVGKIKFNLTK